MRIIRNKEVRHVAIADRKKGWPQLADNTPDTQYRVRGDRVIAFVTDIGNSTLLGWDTCGTCMRYINNCQCKAVVPPRYVIYCYRSRRHLPDDNDSSRGYIGLVHEVKAGKRVARFDIESPLNRRRRLDAEQAAKGTTTQPKRPTIKRRADVPDDTPAVVRRIVRSRADAPVKAHKIVIRKKGR